MTPVAPALSQGRRHHYFASNLAKYRVSSQIRSY
jgi:hypothetical protein